MRSSRAGGPAALAALVLAVAAFLRVWRLSWGLADLGWFPDELIFTDRVARFVPLSWASFDLQSLIYPTFYGYLAGAVAAGANALGLLGSPPGPFSPDMFVIGRAVSAAVGVSTVGIAGLIGTRLYAPRVGLAAAALLAVTPFHAMHAHIAATDVTLAACAALTLLAAFALAERPALARAVLAGASAALGLATKYTGIVFLAPVGWAVAEAAARTRSLRTGLVLGLAALGSFGGTFAIACPPCWLHVDLTCAALTRLHLLATALSFSFANNYLASSLGWYGRPYLYQLFASLPFTLGWPLYGLALAGLGVAIWRRELGDRMILALVVPYFLVIGRYPLVFPRYLMPLFPGLVVLAARAAAEPWAWGRARGVVFAAVWLYSVTLTASQIARFSSDQQRALVAWIARESASRYLHTPVRVAVPSDPMDYFRLRWPLARAGLSYLTVEDGHWLDGAPEVLVLPEFKEISTWRDRPAGRAAGELAHLEAGDAGYREAARWRSWYLQRDLYTRLDPAFAGDLWQGEIGFAVYLREPVAESLNGPP